MSQLSCQCRSHQLMVGRLILYLHFVLSLMERNPCAHKGKMHKHINLIKCHPIPHFPMKPLKNNLTVTQIRVNQLPASPGTIFLLQSQRYIKMTDGNNRLNMVAKQLIDHFLIKTQPFLVGYILLPGGKNPRPSKRKTITLKSHLRH